MSLRVEKRIKFEYAIGTLSIEVGKLEAHLRDLDRFMQICPEKETGEHVLTTNRNLRDLSEALLVLKQTE